MKNNLDELNKYVVQASIGEELIREQNESLNPKSETKVIGEIKYVNNNNLSHAVRKVLSEALLGEMCGDIDGSQDANEDPRIKKSQALVRIIQDSCYKLKESSMPGTEDEDIKSMMISMSEPIIKMAVAKLYHIWYSDQKKEPDIESSVKIVSVEPGDNIVSPQGTEYSVESVTNNSIALVESGTGKKASVDVANISNWKKK